MCDLYKKFFLYSAILYCSLFRLRIYVVTVISIMVHKLITANRAACTSLTEWKYKEEREPAQHEHSDDDAERFGGLLLALELGHFSRDGDAQVRRPMMAV